MEINFKVAETSDIETLVNFIRGFYEFDGHIFDENSIRTTLLKLLLDANLGRVWLIRKGEEAIGYIVITFGYSLEYRGRDAFIDEFYIRASDRGQGIGKQTIQFLEKICSELEINALHLEVERHNTKAQNFYRQVGFVDQNRYLMTKLSVQQYEPIA
ncbi:GNAT family N-acetyltransferase [Scytonema millei]|uniref:GNAT family N-acetyltransferase n=1 Tax=Scytonema millei VB511283 TaxID=1245923 RepID=A0A9X5E5K3_9CYAN|nr:GNAT family N-acetyltransferase [Scytonema millei]NHC35632.1 GNAT family N-acetyltransferase [Scytonema millei VB511283]